MLILVVALAVLLELVLLMETYPLAMANVIVAASRSSNASSDRNDRKMRGDSQVVRNMPGVQLARGLGK